MAEKSEELEMTKEQTASEAKDASAAEEKAVPAETSAPAGTEAEKSDTPEVPSEKERSADDAAAGSGASDKEETAGKKTEAPENAAESEKPSDGDAPENEKDDKKEDGKKEKKEKRPQGIAGFIASVALPLLVICAVTAALMALVNGMTIDRINENAEIATREAINRIYPVFDSQESIVESPELPVTEVFRLEKDGQTLGYCVAVEPKGFNGAIEMMVGISPQGIITGVEIISHSETPGVGARADDPQYLDGYDGLSGRVSFGDGIDALSGATISSKAILSGVNAATEIVSGLTGDGGAGAASGEAAAENAGDEAPAEEESGEEAGS